MSLSYFIYKEQRFFCVLLNNFWPWKIRSWGVMQLCTYSTELWIKLGFFIDTQLSKFLLCACAVCRKICKTRQYTINGVFGQKETLQFSFKYGWVMASVNLWKISSDCKLKYLSKKREFFRIWNLVICHTVKWQTRYQQMIPLCLTSVLASGCSRMRKHGAEQHVSLQSCYCLWQAMKISFSGGKFW